jgi:ABC-type oligopeptide transport system substrate-binding subunit
MQPLILQLKKLFLLLLVTSGTAHAESASLHVRLSSAPRTLDWNIATTGSEGAIIQNIMEGLFSQDVTGFPKPNLAKSFAWSDHQKVLTLVLKTEVKWSDGRALDAHDFLTSFERLLNPKVNSENASLLFDVEGARDYFLGKSKSFDSVGVKALNKHSLQFTLKEPRATLLAILTHWSTFPMRKEGPQLTLGAYRLKARTASVIKLEAARPNLPIQNATFDIISSGSEALKMFREKKIDYLLQLEDSLMTSTELKGLPEPGLVDPARVVALLHFNPSRVVTNSPEKRRAVMSEIPLASLIKENPKTRTPANSIIPAGTLGGPSSNSTEFFSPEGIRDQIPDESLTLAYPDDALSHSIATEIQKDSPHLKIKIEPLPAGELSVASKRYDLVLTLFGLDYLDPDQLLSSFLSQGTHDLFNVSSGELLKIIQKARLTEDLTARGKLYQDAANLLENKIAMVMPLFYRRRGFLMRDRFIFDERRQGTANLTQIHLKK